MSKQARTKACLLVFVLTVSWAGAVDINGNGAGLFLNTPHSWGGSTTVNGQNARLISMGTFDRGAEEVNGGGAVLTLNPLSVLLPAVGETGFIGDVNNDGSTDSLDATLLKLLLLFGGDADSLNTLLATLGQPPINASFGDVNLDGKVDSLDATLIKLYLLFGKDLAALNALLQQLDLSFTVHIGEGA